MKKYLMAAVALICMTMMVSMTSCTNEIGVGDNPVIIPQPEPVGPDNPKPVALADAVKLYTVPQSLYKLDTKELLPFYVVVDGAYENEKGDTLLYDLSTITNVTSLNENEVPMFTVDATQLADHGYIKLIPNMESQELQFFVEDMELAQMEGSHLVALELTNNKGEKMKASLELTYVYPTVFSIKKEIKVADLDEEDNYTIELPEDILLYKLNEWPFKRMNDAVFCDVENFFYEKVVDDKLIVTTDGHATDPDNPNKLTYTFQRSLVGIPNLFLPAGDGLMVNYRIELELIVTP